MKRQGVLLVFTLVLALVLCASTTILSAPGTGTPTPATLSPATTISPVSPIRVEARRRVRRRVRRRIRRRNIRRAPPRSIYIPSPPHVPPAPHILTGPGISSTVTRVIDGDTIDVSGVGRVRLVGVNTPEERQPGFQEAKDFMTNTVLNRTVRLNIDDLKPQDRYGRTRSVVYVNGMNVNAELLRRGHGKIEYITPSEFNPHLWA